MLAETWHLPAWLNGPTAVLCVLLAMGVAIGLWRSRDRL